MQSLQSSAFENWIEEIANCKSLQDSQLAFAWELHYQDQYENCLTILEKILSEEPKSVPALTCKADILVHLERLDEAHSVVECVLQVAPENSDAWETRGDVFEWREDWKGLLDNCARWEKCGRLTRWAKGEICIHRAIAHCAMDNAAELESNLQLYLSLYGSDASGGNVGRRRKTAIYRIFRTAGKPLPAEYAPKAS